MRTGGDLPSIFEFLDFREYLAKVYQARKALDKKFSQRFIMEKVGATSPSWFNDVVKGRIGLTGRHFLKLAQVLGLTAKETDYFEALVDYAQAETLEEKNRRMRRLMSFKGIPMEILGQEKFEYYRHWYYTTIRELLFFYGYSGDAGELAKKLRPTLRKEQAAKAISLLEALGLIRKNARGEFRPTSSNIVKDSRFASVHMANFIRSNIQLALDAWERIPKEERDISTVTVCLSFEGFSEAKSELRAFRNKLLQIAEQDSKPNRVYQCNLQLFPTTQ